MPTYDYKCPVCNRGREVIKTLAKLDEPEHCFNCGGAMNRQISAPRIVADYPAYQSPVTGEWVEGRKAHREDLAKHGCRILEPGEREAYARARKLDDEALDRSVDHTVDGFIANLPTDKRDSLAAAVEHGMDASIIRQ